VINFGAKFWFQLKKIVIKNLEQLWVSIGLDEELKVRSLEPILLLLQARKKLLLLLLLFLLCM